MPPTAGAMKIGRGGGGHASASRHNSALRPTLLVWIVVAFPSASASPSRRASTWCLGLCHSLRLNLSSRSSCSVGCCLAQRLNPHLVATPPGALASTSCLSLARDSIWRCPLPLLTPYPSRTMSPPNIAISIVVAARIRCQCGAFFAVAVAAGTLTRVRCQRRVSPDVSRRACPLPGHGPKEGANQVDDVRVPGTPLELGQQASCVS